MGRYLAIAFSLVAVSVVLSVGVLLVLFGVNPFSLPAPGDAPDASQRANIISAIAALSTAISTLFALVVGAIAILVLINLSRAEATAVEQLKRDLLSIESALLTLRNRSFLYQDGTDVNTDLDPFEHERETLANLLLSPTGYAIYIWSETSGREKYPDLFVDIGSLVNWLTLDLGRYFGPVSRQIAYRSTAMVIKLAKIDDADRRTMAGYLSDIDASMRTASQLAATDAIGAFVTKWKEDNESQTAPPTEVQLEWYRSEAERTIGRQAADMVHQYGRAAIDGKSEDRVKFQTLVTGLHLGVPPDTVDGAATDSVP